ncbi:hypothetical protein [Pelagovum pacificum]|uniref:Alpha/beta hydrolase n=1 Tax=Pelagovum pacificum TaxID=2588711 RepID=A0A5C5GFI3_9RHOB|nr:hypothetical protein [Pelagovum pacificum]QQA43915.1 hypothetical protein I8N54_04870 [Pelagovum pacificum]TNY32954.1 hypothetical protein FHY64_06670 [Pelagovum pacificum]
MTHQAGRASFQLRLHDESDPSIVVFFAGRGSCGPVVVDNYGGHFAKRQGLNILLVQPFLPNWYQGPVARAMPKVLRKLLGPFGPTTFVGAGMGAYGALLAAQAIPADRVIAIRPVSSLDPWRAPSFENRPREMKRLGTDIDPVLTHRARDYQVFADGGATDGQAARFFLPADRTHWHDATDLPTDSSLPLTDERLLGLLVGPESGPERKSAAG